MGTPDFAVASLQALLQDEHYHVVGVVTQPDRPAGRKLQLTPSPIKQLALNHGLPVVTPESLRKDPAAVETIRSWGAEVGVVVAFGQILTEDFMSSFRLGCVNVHGSLLPQWRGAAPIQRSLEAGDTETGVTLQKMVKQLDAGPIIGVRKVSVNSEINALELHDQLAKLGADLLHVELMDYVRGNLVPVSQDESQVTVAKKIDKAECFIDFKSSAAHVHGKTRGFVYGPGVYTLLNGKKIKLHKTAVGSDDSSEFSNDVAKGPGMVAGAGALPVQDEPGRVLAVTDAAIVVACQPGRLAIIELQPESRTRMSVRDFLKGHDLKVGDRFGV